MNRFKPAVSKNALFFLAGLTWLLVGFMLLRTAGLWLIGARVASWIYVVPGIILALVIHHFGFLRIVDKNVARIEPLEGKRCLFSFFAWKSYLTIAVMVAMGFALRHSSLPKQYLAILYIAIGAALVLSSVRYFRTFFRFISFFE